jgi:predicted acyl esterase
MSKSTSEAFAEVIEWAADQPWSTGKIGLLGISYFAGTQWRVAARRPRGLAAIIPDGGLLPGSVPARGDPNGAVFEALDREAGQVESLWVAGEGEEELGA